MCGLKVLNPETGAVYLAAVRGGQAPWDRSFEYNATDLRIFYLTRRLAALEIDQRRYVQTFWTDPLEDFPREFGALLDEGLLEVTATTVRPMPRGMFYADSIAALLAWRQTEARGQGKSPSGVSLRDAGERQQSGNDNFRGYM
jgi:coproporphyrinogen III oxidase-like Fe-S oxidoreductase